MSLPGSEAGGVPRWYQIYTVAVVAVAGLLIWWGAAVTTEHVGLAVPDWPKSYGSWGDPVGWMQNHPVFLEHGHRRLASLVGLLTLGLCAGAWFGTRKTILRRATSIAVVLVILQGVLGGVRVLRVSDHFGIAHGCLGQTFFCLLLLIALIANGWLRRRPVLDGVDAANLRRASTALYSMVFLQLIFGAVVRHTQRFELADHGVLLTGASWFPGFGRADLFILFLHKWWGGAIAVSGLCLVAGLFRRVANHALFAGMRRLFVLAVLVQPALGIGVILTGKSFWITNFHVINGLVLLASTFVLMILSWRAVPGTSPESLPK